jgi:hypothetical protein
VTTVELLLVVALVAAFEIAALRWGYDSRDGFRETHPYPALEVAPRRVAARRRVASGLRGLAFKLDPSLNSQPTGVALSPSR